MRSSIFIAYVYVILYFGDKAIASQRNFFFAHNFRYRAVIGRIETPTFLRVNVLNDNKYFHFALLPRIYSSERQGRVELLN